MGFPVFSPGRRLFRRFGRLCLCALLLLGGAAFCARQAGAPVDLLITNARIVDGTGNPWYRGWVAVAGSEIVSVGTHGEPEARRIMDAGDRVVAPGFIDLHNHCDQGLFEVPEAESFVRQGVTTLIGGPEKCSGEGVMGSRPC